MIVDHIDYSRVQKLGGKHMQYRPDDYAHRHHLVARINKPITAKFVMDNYHSDPGEASASAIGSPYYDFPQLLHSGI
jgi:hypothetical protein